MAPPSGPVTPPVSSWSYGYGGVWSPPPQPSPPKAPRRIVAAIAVAILVLASGAVGAAISAAVHNDSTSPSVTGSPFTPLPNNNGLGSGTTPGAAGSNGSSGIASKVSPALVNIYTTIDTGAGRGEAAGTGMVITSSGEVLTNNHVIADATSVRVELVENGETHTAKVLGYDVKDDVALLKIDGVSGLNTVSFADASKIAVGDAVVAIGNAGGRGGAPAVSSGSVTALDQKVTAGDPGSGNSETLAGMIEISAPIQPGDSGGPLVNSKAQVIGMNTAAATSDRFSGQSVSSSAFAIPINRAVQLAHQIEAEQDSANVHIGERGLLGVRVRDIASQLTCTSVPANSGALVAGVNSGSPADSAGLGTCDVIVSVGGKNIATTSDLNAAMFPYHPGENVAVGWVDQSGHRQNANLDLVAGPPA
jgi:S1-C subfamily serine protease